MVLTVALVNIAWFVLLSVGWTRYIFLALALSALLVARLLADFTDDFRLEEEHDADLAEQLGIAGGVLKVHCRSTGEERLYATGAGSGWLGAFLMDLARGHFADALRDRAREALPVMTIRQPSVAPLYAR